MRSLSYMLAISALVFVTGAEAKKADDGPDLPYACWQVKAMRAVYTDAELRALGKKYGVKLSRKQLVQAKACLK